MSELTGPDTDCPCARCGTRLWNDHGLILDDGKTIVCRNESRCRLKVVAQDIERKKAAGTWHPRWRK